MPPAPAEGEKESRAGAGYALAVHTGSLAGLRGLLIDLDGVVYTGRQAIPGSAGFLHEARRRGLPFFLVTNNSTATPETVAQRLRGMDIQVDAGEIVTSAEAAVAYVVNESPHGARVLLIGETGLREAVARTDLEVVAEGDADWVVVGLDRQFTYAKLVAITRAIQNGARFVATNADPLLPSEGGLLNPGAGSIIAAIETATGMQPIIVGKPSPGLFQRGLDRLGSPPPDSVAMVGDRLDTDIIGARQVGLKTILVLTGGTTEQQLGSATVRPDVVVADLAGVAGLLGWA